MGVYKRVQPDSVEGTGHTFQLAYRKWPVGSQDDGSGWVMGLANAPEEGGHEVVGGKKSVPGLTSPTQILFSRQVHHHSIRPPKMC